MELFIENNSIVQELARMFNSHFPFLKIEFFSKGKGSLNGRTTLASLGYNVKPGTVSLNGNQKVSSFEKRFRDKFDIHLQVYRKSGRSWLMTTSTGSWTLSQQNKMGAELETTMQKPAKKDFDEYNEKT